MDLATGRRPPMTPSRVQNERIGGYDFHQTGRELAAILRSLGRLEPHERVLDAGCGYGRLAVPLTSYLTTGEYAGFDIDARAIAWCRRHISTRHANFWFAHADIANSYYNPSGTIAPETFTFPCADSSVDVVVATSLFTHLLPQAAARYVSEVARTLRPGGRAVLSFFLLDDEVRSRLGEPHVQPSFGHFPEPFYGVTEPAQPELAVAYDLAVVRQALNDCSLSVERLERGGWAAHSAPLSYQDFVLAVKQTY